MADTSSPIIASRKRNNRHKNFKPYLIDCLLICLSLPDGVEYPDNEVDGSAFFASLINHRITLEATVSLWNRIRPCHYIQQMLKASSSTLTSHYQQQQKLVSKQNLSIGEWSTGANLFPRKGFQALCTTTKKNRTATVSLILHICHER